jgi:O-antigen ligase
VPGLPLQIVQFATLGVAVLVALRRLAAGLGPLPLSALMGIGVAFCAWLVLALPSAIDRQRALRDVVLFIVGMVTASVVVAACRSLRDVLLVLGVFLAVAALATASTPFSAANVQSSFGGAVVKGRATGIFTQPNQLGTFAATGTLVGIGLFFSAGMSKRLRWAIAAGTGVTLLALLLSLSRGAWIGFTVGVVVLLVKLPAARRALAIGFLPLLVTALAIGSFAPTNPQVEVVGERLRSITGERNPYDSRPAIWAEAWQEIQADPLTGFGPGSFPVASTRATSESRTTFADHAHNLFLTWAAEDGIPAALIAVLLGAALAVRLRRVVQEAPDSQGAVAGVSAALAAVVGQGTVDYTLRNSVICTTLFLVLGCAFALDRVADEPA